jgi:hypothetical protein
LGSDVLDGYSTSFLFWAKDDKRILDHIWDKRSSTEVEKGRCYNVSPPRTTIKKRKKRRWGVRDNVKNAALR